MRIAVLGATGRTGRPLVEGDAYSGKGVERALAGDDDPVDAVVSVLGQTGDGPDALLTEAGRHVHEIPKVADR